MNAERRTPNAEPAYCPKFSIIVPAYNCGKYIAKALDSLINQDIPERNYEIIITDDGSSDDTGAICDTYASRFPFIHVTHTDNHGPSHARNEALPLCRGQYITFCDADDFVSPQMISVLTKALEIYGQPDILVWRVFMDIPMQDWTVYPESGWPSYDVRGMNYSAENMSGRDELCMRIISDVKVQGFGVNKAMKRSLAEGTRFDESLIYAEDEIYFLDVLEHCGEIRVCYLDCFLYCYVQHKNFGLLRNPANRYGKDGIANFIPSKLRILEMKNIPLSARTITQASMYKLSADNLFSCPPALTREARKALRGYMRKYMLYYYLSAYDSMLGKVKTLVKHILLLLHIHK